MDKKIDKLMDILFGTFIVIFPFIVFLKTRSIDPVLYNLYSSNMGMFYDFILLARERFLLVFTLVIVFLFLIRMKNKSIQNIIMYILNNKYIFIFSFIYILLLYLSSFLNYNSYFSLYGGYFDCEGIISITCYLILFIIGCYHFSRNNLNCFKLSIKILFLLFFIFSVLEKLNINVLNIPFIKNIILIGSSNTYLNNINIVGSKLQLFFGNSGYFSWVLILFFPIILNFINDKKYKLFSYILVCFSIWMIIETYSTFSFYIMLFNLILFIIFDKRKVRYLLFIFLIFIIFLIRGNYNIILNKENTSNNKKLITSISINGDKVLFKFKDEAILYDMNQENSSIKMYKDFNVYRFDFGYKDTIDFKFDNNRFYLIKNDVRIDDNVFSYDIKNIRFDKILTGRGYIYRNSIKYISKNILIGHGSNSFIYYFNNNDYLGILNSQESSSFYILKPHSMYLDIIFTSGVLSFINFILFIIYIIYIFFKKRVYLDRFYLCLFIGIINYLIFGILNDSLVLVSLYFYILLSVLASKIKRK